MKCKFMVQNLFYFLILFLVSPCYLFSNDSPGSCAIPKGAVCFDFLSGYTKTDARISCRNYSDGNYSPAKCKQSDRVGVCYLKTSTNREFNLSFYSTKWDSVTAAKKCEDMTGVFSN